MIDEEYDEEDNERIRVALTGMRYPFNTNKNLGIKKQMLEIKVLDKLADKLDDLDEDDEDYEDDEGEEE